MPSILLAEDNPADVFLLREAFSQHQHSIDLRVVSDGEQALDFIESVDGTPENGTPDLIVLDLNLPKSDGADILKRIRQKPHLRGTPVVVLTSSDSPQDRNTTETLGADSFLTKPADLDEFLRLGDTLLKFIRARKSQTQAG